MKFYRIKKTWFLFSKEYRKFYYIEAGYPCDKGELGLLFLVIGWQR